MARALQVPADMLDKARMEVAAKGMPQTGRLGFELFDKPNWVGSEFDERVNYQRALEGELEHTIETLGVVRSARVHLVLPQQSLFASEEKVAKASVVLKLRRSTVDPEQADAIRSLVAGAVENLSPDQVTLVDADGRANLKPRSSDASKDEAEQAMEAKLVAMLEPLAGRDNVRATVNVSYDEGSEERTDEVYDPSQTATLSMQKKRTGLGAAGDEASGVPGTASNSPAGAPAGSVAGSQAAAAPGTPPLLQKQALPVYPQQGSGTGPEHSGRERNVRSDEASGALGGGAGAGAKSDCGGGGERSRDDRGHGQAGAHGLEAAKRGRDASAGATGAGSGWLRCAARRPGGDGERQLQHECSGDEAAGDGQGDGRGAHA